MPGPLSVLDDRQEQTALEMDCLFIVRRAWQWDSSFSQPFLEQIIWTSMFCCDSVDAVVSFSLPEKW